MPARRCAARARADSASPPGGRRHCAGSAARRSRSPTTLVGSKVTPQALNSGSSVELASGAGMPPRAHLVLGERVDEDDGRLAGEHPLVDARSASRRRDAADGRPSAPWRRPAILSPDRGTFFTSKNWRIWAIVCCSGIRIIGLPARPMPSISATTGLPRLPSWETRRVRSYSRNVSRSGANTLMVARPVVELVAARPKNSCSPPVPWNDWMP